MEDYPIGLLGWGTVGGGVLDILETQVDDLAKRCDFHFRVKRIVTRDPSRPREQQAGDAIIGTDINDILRDDEIRAVLHLVGGTTDAKDLALACLRAGKHVITANKALLAEHWEEMYGCANEHGVVVAFEAAVAGAIPIVSSLRDGFVANHLTGIQGILNGTCNYVLTMMEEKGLSYEEALKQAQELGYAEADPTLDVDGSDTAHKLAILARIATRSAVGFHDFPVQGIQDIRADDIEAARQLGFRFKLLGRFVPYGSQGALISVEPVLLPLDHQLATVRLNYNAIRVEGHAAGPNLLVGQGAGALPTASAVLADLVEVATGSYEATARRFRFFHATSTMPVLDQKDEIADYYIRFTVPDRPGVLAGITGLLSDYGVNIRSMRQGEPANGIAHIDVVCNRCRRGDLYSTLDHAAADNLVMEPGIIYPILTH